MLGSLEPSIGFCAKLLSRSEGLASYTYTLTSLFGRFLLEAEGQFGERESGWTPLGIQFCGSNPEIWPGVKHVIIILSDFARISPCDAIFELAHETVHLLSPSGQKHALVLEEGIASMFAHDKSRELQLGVDLTLQPRLQNYTDAEMLARELLKIDPFCILKARELEPSFSQLTPAILSRVCKSAPLDLLTELCRPFVYSA